MFCKLVVEKGYERCLATGDGVREWAGEDPRVDGDLEDEEVESEMMETLGLTAWWLKRKQETVVIRTVKRDRGGRWRRRRRRRRLMDLYVHVISRTKNELTTRCEASRASQRERDIILLVYKKDSNK